MIKLYLAFIFGRLLNLNIDIFFLKFFIEIIVIVNIRSENFHSSKLKLEFIRFFVEKFLKSFNEKISHAFNFLAGWKLTLNIMFIDLLIINRRSL